MTLVIFSSIIAYFTTEMDDLLALLVLYSRTQTTGEKVAIVIGKYLGLALLGVGSGFFAVYISRIPSQYIGFLGLVPIGMGLKTAIDAARGKLDHDEEEDSEKIHASGVNIFYTILTTVIITLANGGDNIAVYISFFTALKGFEFVVAAIVFAVMQGIWCAVAWLILSAKSVKSYIQHTQRILIPVLFFVLGIYIMVKSGTIQWLLHI